MGKILFSVFLISLAVYFKSDLALKSAEEEQSFQLEEVSEKLGIQFLHHRLSLPKELKHVEPFLTSLGASVAIRDVDGDGFQDVFLCNTNKSHPNKLFRNLGNGKFEDVAEDVGLANINQPYPCMRPLFFDYDNDGRTDFFMTTLYCPRLFHQEKDGKFRDVTDESGISNYCLQSHASNVLDFDLDGDLDIIFSSFLSVDMYNLKRFDFMFNHQVNATNGGATFLLRNNGDGTFTDVASEVNVSNPGFVNSIGIYDFNKDLWPDIWIANDFNENTLLMNNGKGKFEKRSLGPTGTRSNMNSEVGDLDQDGDPVTLVTQIYAPGRVIQGNVFWKFGEKQKATVVHPLRKARRCGWSWGGKFVDLDNNSYEDIVVAAGHISGKSKNEYWFRYSQILASKKNILADIRNWPEFKDMSLSGYRSNCLYYNDGNRLREITSKSPFKDYALDGRGVASVDYLNTGSMSLVIAHQSGPAHFYKNQQRNQNNWVGFQLQGVQSNKDALGAIVEVRSGDLKVTKQVYPSNSFASQSDSRLHFGLGQRKVVDQVLIRWPSGSVQMMKNLSMNRYFKIIESDKN